MNRNGSRNSILSNNGGSYSYSNSYSHNRRAPADENLDLFSRNRRTLSLSSSDHSSSDVSVKLGRLSVVGSGKPGRGGGPDDLLTSADLGKHDYDWLLTPPGTPLFPSSDVNDSQPATAAPPRTSSLARSGSTAKASSRLSVSQSESNQSSRPARSSSVTRPSVSSSQYTTYSSNKSSNILNTSSASVSSYIRPSSPVTRSPSIARPSTPSSRSSVSRSSTPSRARPSPTTSSSTDRPRPSQSSRPSTPSSRSASISSAPARTVSRPSTPTRRNPATPASPSPSSAGRAASSGRIPAPSSRPSSPSPRIRPPQQPVIPPDFPLDTPPNLRTTLPDRPLSAGRSRPGAALTAKGSSETSSPANGIATRRHSSPIVTRGRITDPPSKGRVYSNGHAAETLEPRKVSHAPESGMRKPVKSTSTVAESAGFGRNISKKSMDMAIRHMDIRNGSGGARSLSSTTLFPQSIRSAAARVQSHHLSSGPEYISGNGHSQNGGPAENGYHIGRQVESGYEVNNGLRSAKLNEVDIYESSRYDAMLLKEDLKNMNWLHSIDDKSDQGSIFDSGFEPLPEPFGPI